MNETERDHGSERNHGLFVAQKSQDLKHPTSTPGSGDCEVFSVFIDRKPCLKFFISDVYQSLL